MRLLVITPYFAPAWKYGPLASYLHELGRKLVARGHQVTVFTTNAHDEHSTQPDFHKKMDGMSVYYFSNMCNALAYELNLFLPLGFGRYLNRFAHEFDFLLLCGSRTTLNIKARKIARKNDVPYAHLAGGTLSANGTKCHKLLCSVLDSLLLSPLIHDVSVAFAQTVPERAEYMELGLKPEQVKLLPAGIDLDTQYENLPPLPDDNPYQIGKGDKVVVTSTVIHEDKMSTLLFDAIGELVKSDSNVKWILVGRDAGHLEEVNQEIIKRKLTKHFVFTGPVVGEEKMQLIKRAGCFLHVPRKKEAQPANVLRALSMGTPCVLSDKCDVPHLVEKAAGEVVGEDADAIALAVRKTLSLGRDAFSENCVMLVKKHFTWPVIAARFEKTVQKVIQPPPEPEPEERDQEEDFGIELEG